jgi:hypothetical protein
MTRHAIDFPANEAIITMGSEKGSVHMRKVRKTITHAVVALAVLILLLSFVERSIQAPLHDINNRDAVLFAKL